MTEVPRAVTAQAALFGAAAAAPAGDPVLGSIALGVDLELGAAVAFIGTPGADNAAAGRVSVMALGASDFPGAVSDVAWPVVALVAESPVATAALPGAVGEADGCADDVTLAVIE
jgi:hypothetical protein